MSSYPSESGLDHTMPSKLNSILNKSRLRTLAFALVGSLICMLVLLASKRTPAHLNYGSVLLSNNDAPHQAPLAQDVTQKPKIIRTQLVDDEARYEKTVYVNQHATSANEEATVLIVSSIGSENAFGDGRTIRDFVHTINTFQYEKSAISLGFLCGSEAVKLQALKYFDFLMKDKPSEFNWARVTVFRESFLGANFGRHADGPSIQRARRRMIARSRNLALLKSLNDERYTLFLDADMYVIRNTDMLQLFIDSGHDIIVPRIEKHGDRDYDRNTWKGRRVHPSEQVLKLMNENKWEEANWEPNDGPNMLHLGAEIERLDKFPENAPERSPKYSFEVDSVGGAILFAKSIIYEQGVIFPPIYIVGTDWDRVEGYDGIETEGICYVATLLGYKCWAMPNLVADHV